MFLRNDTEKRYNATVLQSYNKHLRGVWEKRGKNEKLIFNYIYNMYIIYIIKFIIIYYFNTFYIIHILTSSSSLLTSENRKNIKSLL